MRLEHGFDPVFDEHSRVLILGSFPSAVSRKNMFYYAHPRNRFWPVLSAVLGEPVPISTDDRKAMLLTHGIALWDVISSCDIEGSSDASIRDVIPHELDIILTHADIRAVFTNGGAADRLYKKYQLPRTHIPSIRMPSTSPANAAWSSDRLISEWKAVADILRE